MKDPDTATFRRSDAPTLKHPDTTDFAGGPSDPPTLRRSGPRASRLAHRPVQVLLPARPPGACKNAHTRAQKSHFSGNHRIAKRATNSYRFVRSAVAPTARKSARMHTSEMQKVCIPHFWVRRGRCTKIKRHTFAYQKVCLLALSRPIGATADVTKPYEFIANIVIL